MTYKEWLSSLNQEDYYWYEHVYEYDMEKAYECECEDKR